MEAVTQAVTEAGWKIASFVGLMLLGVLISTALARPLPELLRRPAARLLSIGAFYAAFRLVII